MGLLLALALAALLAPAAQASASWTPPSVLVKGDDAALLDTVALPDGRLRLAIVDSRRGIAMGLVDGRPFRRSAGRAALAGVGGAGRVGGGRQRRGA